MYVQLYSLKTISKRYSHLVGAVFILLFLTSHMTFTAQRFWACHLKKIQLLSQIWWEEIETRGNMLHIWNYCIVCHIVCCKFKVMEPLTCKALFVLIFFFCGFSQQVDKSQLYNSNSHQSHHDHPPQPPNHHHHPYRPPAPPQWHQHSNIPWPGPPPHVTVSRMYKASEHGHPIHQNLIKVLGFVKARTVDICWCVF